MKKNEKYKSSFEKLLPEPQPNSEPLLIGLPSATLAQNAMLVAGLCYNIYIRIDFLVDRKTENKPVNTNIYFRKFILFEG